MAKRIKIHPLFLAIGIISVFLGNGIEFVLCTLTAVIHEFGHISMSKMCGVSTQELTIMPYGAMVNANLGYLNHYQNIKIALCGPLINLVFAILITSLWWIFPQSYPYTVFLVTINVSIGLINLLPCYPLDGGRIAISLLSLKYRAGTAILIGRVLGLILGVAFTLLFIISCFYALNWSFLIMGLFVIIGALNDVKQLRYNTGVCRVLEDKKLDGPVIIKRVLVPEETMLFRLVGFLDKKRYCVFDVVDRQSNALFSISETRLFELLKCNNSMQRVGKCRN